MACVESCHLICIYLFFVFKAACVQVERALDAVAVEDLNESAVVDISVVVAHGECLHFAVGVAVSYAFHCLFSFKA